MTLDPTLELTIEARMERGAALRALLEKLRAKSELEFGHASRVAVYAVATGERLGLSDQELLDLRYGAALHDIGKLSWPDRLFQGGTQLTENERVLIQAHPLRGVKEISGFEWLKGARSAILYHHERWDGSGYPDGLAGTKIPLPGRIVAMTEMFDTLTMPPGWRTTLPEGDALVELKRIAGSWLDPEVVEAFLAVQPIIQPVGL